ncbi:unnamed protein product [Calypogeia fissa]
MPPSLPEAFLASRAAAVAEYVRWRQREQARAMKERLVMLGSEVRDLKRKLAFLQKVDRDYPTRDVTFFVDQKPVAKAHRFILTSRSLVFRKMFDTDMAERRSGEIHVNDLSAITLQALVKFIYTAEVTFTEACAAELFMAAQKYDIPELQEECEVELCAGVFHGNVLELLDFAEFYDMKRLKDACDQFFKSKVQLQCNTFVQENHNRTNFF